MAAVPIVTRVEESFTDSDIHNESYKPGLNMGEVRELYDQWHQYNTYTQTDRYKGPSYAAQTVVKYFKNKERCCIADLGAGTGRLGIELMKRGYTHLSAIEGSSGMISNAPAELYTTIYPFYIGENETEIPSDQFDCCASSGVFIPNHIPVAGLNEIIRIVKPGGMFITIMRETYLEDEFYADKLEAYMLQLENKGYWSQLERSVVPNYFANDNGVIFAYRVHKAGF